MEIEQVTEAIAGDKSALEQLLKKHYQELYKTAFLYVKNEGDALDIVQDSVIKIMLKISTLKEPAYFLTWAVRIVMNTSLDLVRKKTNSDLTDIEEQLTIEEPVSSESRLDIYQGLASLPPSLQEITILHYFHGRKLQEISEIVEEPLGTTKYKLHQARKLLRNYLEGGVENET